MKDAIAELIDASPLGLDGAWRLADDEIDELTEPDVPSASRERWRSLASLIAGTELFDASKEEFTAAVSQDALARIDEAELRKRLVSAFSARLVPPTTAAGLYIMLGIHPAWGVYVAQRVSPNNDGDGDSADGLFPDDNARLIIEALADSMRRILDAVREHEGGEISDLVDDLHERLDEVHRSLADKVSDDGLAAVVDIDRPQHWNQDDAFRDFVTNDVFAHWLVASGAVDFDRAGGTYYIRDEDALLEAEILSAD